VKTTAVFKAGFGPLFVTVTVFVNVSPGLMDGGEERDVARSAGGVSVVEPLIV
jgi:hypothetical protein